jgi:hypothetical protein
MGAMRWLVCCEPAIPCSGHQKSSHESRLCQSAKLILGIQACMCYEFSQPTGSNVETCTSFYVFSGFRWLTCWVGYWTPTQPHHHLSAFYRWMPTPWHHCLQHTIGSKCTSWFGAICPLWRAPVPFLNAPKLLILSCQRTDTIDARINQLKHVVR